MYNIKQQKFALIDCNNFFVSCERLFNPQLRNKAIVILSGNDGCIVARSQEAKQLGIKMGEPFFKCKDLITQHKVEVISGNLVLYSDISRRVMNTLKEITNKVHIYSIDEAFLEIDDINISPEILGQKIRKLIYKKVGIPVSVGIASSKTLCKIATDLAKSNPQQYKGCFSFLNTDPQTILADLPIQDVWGIGRQTAQKLIDNRIFTIGHFLTQSEKQLKKIFSSKIPMQTFYELQGISCIPFRERSTPQSILCSRSLDKELSDISTIKSIISGFVVQAYRRLFKTGSVARSLSITMNENRFKVDDYKNNLSHRFEHAHRDFQLFLQIASELVEKNFDPRKKYKQIGVTLYDIHEKNYNESSLFTENNDHKSERLFDVMEFINTKYNKSLIKPLSAKTVDNFSRREFRSKRYTTDWDEILEIHI